MKQSSLDIAMNICLDALYENNLDELDKLNNPEVIDRIEILQNVRLFFVNYDKNIGGVEKEKIKTLDCSRERRDR